MTSNQIQKILKRVIIPGETTTKCWGWKGGYNTGGYAQITLLVHRILYEHLIGEIPDNLHCDHICRNRKCVNPHHIELVTPKENTLRGVGTGALNSRKTHCKNGHEFSKSNTYINKTSKARVCRICVNAFSNTYYHKKQAQKHRGDNNG